VNVSSIAKQRDNFITDWCQCVEWESELKRGKLLLDGTIPIFIDELISNLLGIFMKTIVINNRDRNAECKSLESALYVVRLDSIDQLSGFTPEANQKDGISFNRFADKEAHGEKHPVSYKQEEVSLYAFNPLIKQVIMDVVQATLQSEIKLDKWNTLYFEYMAVVVILKPEAKTATIQGKAFTTRNVDAINITFEVILKAISQKVVNMEEILIILEFHTHVPIGRYDVSSLQNSPEEMSEYHGLSEADVDGSVNLYHELKRQNQFIKLQSYVVPFHLYYLDEYKNDEYKFVSRISIGG